MERVTAGKEYVHPKIEFKTVNQKRLVNILLHYKPIQPNQLLRILRKEYAFSLRFGVWLYYKSRILISLINNYLTNFLKEPKSRRRNSLALRGDPMSLGRRNRDWGTPFTSSLGASKGSTCPRGCSWQARKIFSTRI